VSVKRLYQKLFFCSALLFLGLGTPIQAAASRSLTLEQILNRIDKRGETLRSLSAVIVQKKWTDILEEFDQGEKGHFYFLKQQGKIYLRKDISEPQENTLIVREDKVLFYQPKIKQVQSYNLGQRKSRAEFLLLGFGSDKQALKESYDIRLLEKEVIEGRDTYPLELVPKSEKVSAYFSQIVLWIDSTLWVPVQQKLLEPTEDFLLICFQDIQLNSKISKSRFDLKFPKDVKVVGE
jgi:outer membrane lipoprotein-sorting protein